MFEEKRSVFVFAMVTLGVFVCGAFPAAARDISGKAFLDVDADGALGAGEPLLENVTLYLFDANRNQIAQTSTDGAGAYVFTGLANGIYGVTPPAWTNGEDLNEVLYAYFPLTTPMVAVANVWGGNSSGNNFGFTPEAVEILGYLNGDNPFGECAACGGDGRTIGFWKHQLSVAIKGKGKAQVDANTLRGYLNSIESLYLPVPFQFGGSFQAALDVLSSTSSNPTKLLAKQLLGLEFNHVSGHGLLGRAGLMQPLLIAWGEYMMAHSAEFTRDELLLAKDIFDAINNLGEN